MKKSRIIRNLVSLAVPDGSQAGNHPRLFNRLLFFFPVLVDDNYSNYQPENQKSEKSITNFIHKPVSPLSRKIPTIKKIMTMLRPTINEPVGILFGETILPTIITAKTIWLKLNRTFAKFSLCFFVNLIYEILSKVKISVKLRKLNQTYGVKQIICIPPLVNGSPLCPEGTPFLGKRGVRGDLGAGGIFRKRLGD